MPPYELHAHCSVDDSKQVATCHTSAFWTETWWRMLWPEKTLDALIAIVATRTPRNLLQMRDVRRHQKVVDTESGDIVGYARWVLPKSHAGKWPEAQTPDVDDETRQRFQKEFGDVEYEPRDDMDELDDHAWEWRSKYDHEDCLELDYLATDPKHTRKGISTMLVQSGVKAAAQLGLDIIVIAMGSSSLELFKKAGFELLEKESQDLSPYGEESVYETFYLIKRAPKEAEAAK